MISKSNVKLQMYAHLTVCFFKTMYDKTILRYNKLFALCDNYLENQEKSLDYFKYPKISFV